MATLIYDGDCKFCSACARFAQKRLRYGEVVAYQGLPSLSEVDLTEDDVACASWWIDNRGKKFRGERGIAKTLKACGAPWNLAGFILDLPVIRHVAYPIYWFVSKNRHLMPGGSNSCRIDHAK